MNYIMQNSDAVKYGIGFCVQSVAALAEQCKEHINDPKVGLTPKELEEGSVTKALFLLTQLSTCIVRGQQCNKVYVAWAGSLGQRIAFLST